MPKTLIFIGVAATYVATGAHAETCTFTIECYENEACAETNFEIDIEKDKLVTPAETIAVTSGGSATKGVFVGYTASAFHVLTREIAGQARYSTHFFSGPIMVNYMGNCE